MAVFMSPRTSYVLGRFGAHGIMSWFLSFGILCGVLGVLAKPFSPTSLTLFGLTGYGLSTQRGRRNIKRTAKEAFYGNLTSFTGTCSSDMEDEIGGGGSHSDDG